MKNAFKKGKVYKSIEFVKSSTYYISKTVKIFL